MWGGGPLWSPAAFSMFETYWPWWSPSLLKYPHMASLLENPHIAENSFTPPGAISAYKEADQPRGVERI